VKKRTHWVLYLTVHLSSSYRRSPFFRVRAASSQVLLFLAATQPRLHHMMFPSTNSQTLKLFTRSTHQSTTLPTLVCIRPENQQRPSRLWRAFALLSIPNANQPANKVCVRLETVCAHTPQSERAHPPQWSCSGDNIQAVGGTGDRRRDGGFQLQ
jgi:hypothetical protein